MLGPGAVFARSNRIPLNEEKSVDFTNREETRMRLEFSSASYHAAPCSVLTIPEETNRKEHNGK